MAVRGKVPRHAPDFFARLAGGGALVVGSRPLDRIGERDREAFAAAGAACARLGWRYAVQGSTDPVAVANLRWLAGYRHPRCHDEAVAALLREAFTQPELIDGTETAGDPLATLPVLYYLIWRHELSADLSLVLSHRSVLRAAAAAEGGHG